MQPAAGSNPSAVRGWLLVALACGLLGGARAAAQVSLSALDVAVAEDFDALAGSGTGHAWTDNATLAGWYASRGTYDASTGSSTAGGLYSFGLAAAPADRALGSLGSNTTGAVYWAVRLVNATGSAVGALDVAYSGEQWRDSGAAAQALNFEYRVAEPGAVTGANEPAAGWFAAPELDFVSPVVTGSAGAVDGNAAGRQMRSAMLPLFAAPGQEIWLRWVDANHDGNDHALAVDDFSAVPRVAPPTATPTPSATATATGTPTPTATGTPTPTAPPLLTIAQIQGSGTSSPYAGQRVTTRGVVTARRGNSFFLQMPDPGDGDPATSDGLLVFSSASFAAAQVGNLVEVRGTVVEFRPGFDTNSPPLTELGAPLEVTLLAGGQPLPVPVLLTAAETDPAGPLEQLERFEGMRVRVNDLTVVAPTQGSLSEASATASSNGIFHGVVTGVARPLREPGIEAPDPIPPTTSPAPCCPARFDGNPERLRVDSDAQSGAAALDVASGDRVLNVVGVLDYGVRTYTIYPDPAPPPAVSGGRSAAPLPAPAPDELTVGTLNLQRLFDDRDEPGLGEPVLTPAAYQGRLTKASRLIRTVLQAPDVLGVQEVENLATLQALAARVNNDAAGAGQPSPGYRAFLVEGNDIGGIDVGLLVRSRVAVASVVQEGKSETFVNPQSGQTDLLHDRPPLRLNASVPAPSGGAFAFTVIVVHQRSFSDHDDDNAPDGDGVSGPRVREKRRRQAESVARLVQARQALGEPVLLAGDFNAFEFNDGYVDVLGTVRGQPAGASTVVLASPDLVEPDLTDLVATIAEPAGRYSYTFDGNAQVLDHVLVTEDLLARVTRFHYARTNADFPAILFQDTSRPERLSDHDPGVAYISLAGVPTPAATPSPTAAPRTLSGQDGAGGALAMLGLAAAALLLPRAAPGRRRLRRDGAGPAPAAARRAFDKRGGDLPS